MKRLPLPPQMRWRLTQIEFQMGALSREQSALVEGFVLAHNVEPGYKATVADGIVEVLEEGEQPPESK